MRPSLALDSPMDEQLGRLRDDNQRVQSEPCEVDGGAHEGLRLRYVPRSYEWFARIRRSTATRNFPIQSRPTVAISAVNRFPSAANGAGFSDSRLRSLACSAIWNQILRVSEASGGHKIPIADSTFSAADGADTSPTPALGIRQLRHSARPTGGASYTTHRNVRGMGS